MVLVLFLSFSFVCWNVALHGFESTVFVGAFFSLTLYLTQTKTKFREAPRYILYGTTFY